MRRRGSDQTNHGNEGGEVLSVLYERRLRLIPLLHQRPASQEFYFLLKCSTFEFLRKVIFNSSLNL